MIVGTKAPSAAGILQNLLERCHRGQTLLSTLARARSQTTRVAALDLLEDVLETIKLDANDLLSREAN
jgi:hypothetical protein